VVVLVWHRVSVVDVEALLAAYDAQMRLPSGAVPTGVTHEFDGPVLVADLRRFADLQTEVFGVDCSWVAADLASRISADRDQITVLVAETGGRVVCGAFAEFCPGTDFVALLGGATLPDWRGRGLYRAMIAARAQAAVARGFRLLHVDASPASAPVLRRCGFHEVTTSTHYRWAPVQFYDNGSPHRPHGDVEADRVYGIDHDMTGTQWQRLDEIYRTLPGFSETLGSSVWFGAEGDPAGWLVASVEPSGLHVSGRLPAAAWQSWTAAFQVAIDRTDFPRIDYG
jgi:GNAT superfamily N-acetyltransferase